MSDRAYCYPPDFSVLRNRFGIRDPRQLDSVERRVVLQRMREPIPVGDFDLVHLRSIHRHLFQDLYDWAGDLRTVEITKDGHQFQFRRYIQIGFADVHTRLVARNHLQTLSRADFAQAAGEIIGDVNYVHPFREGNGRTQLLYLRQLAERAGHPMNLARLDPSRWMEASRRAHSGDYSSMSSCICDAIDPE